MDFGKLQRCLVFSIPTLILALLAFALIGSSWAQQTASKAPSVRLARVYDRPTDPSLYVGSETCKTCPQAMPSKDFFHNFEASPRFVTTLDTKKGLEWQGCEACHAPGKAHVEAGGRV